MKKIILAIAVVGMFGCGGREVNRQFCYCNEKDKASEWISQNIKPSNNMSDEEMEDVIRQLNRTAMNLFCHEKKAIWNSYSNTLKYELDSCETLARY